jgi:hypothetical protein
MQPVAYVALLQNTIYVLHIGIIGRGQIFLEGN